ncbi:unnamed protein product [Mytilus coruscus]|uniref:Uncharacterized protein n=1 Tax=Mytilus coruscus TaxID=42192 RepID=A0A6J8EY57_MYTCO|nr:unnamed protein product [Mytilus coruscus]
MVVKEKVPECVALHLPDNDSSVISPVGRLLGNAANYINNKNSNPKAKVIWCGKIRDSLIIEFSDNKAELKSAIDKYFGRDVDKPNPPPAKKKKTACTKPAILLKTHSQSAISPESVLSTEANCDILSLSSPPSVPSTQPTSTQRSPHSSVQAVSSPLLSVPSTQPTSTQRSPHSSVQAVLSTPLSVPSPQPTSTQRSPHSSVQAVLSPPLSVPSTQPTSTQRSPHSSVQAVSSPLLSVPSTQPTSTQRSPHSSVQAVLSTPLSVPSPQPTSTQRSPHSSVQAVFSPPLSVPLTQPTSTQRSPHSSVQAVLSPPLSVPSTQPTSTQRSPHSSVQAVSQSSFQSAAPCNYVSTKSTHSAMYSQPSIQPNIPQPLINPISDIQSTFHSQSTTFHSLGSTQSPTFFTQQIFVAEPFVPMFSSSSENSTQSSMSSARQGTSFIDDPTDSSDILSNSNVQHIIASPESERLLQSIMKDNINTTPSCQMVNHCSCLDRIEKTMNEALKVLISMQSLNPSFSAPPSTETNQVIPSVQSSVESCIPESLPRYTTEIPSSTLPSSITQVRNPKPSLPLATSSNILSTSSARDILAELNCQSNIPDKEPIAPISLSIRTPVNDPQFLSLSLTTILQNKPSSVKTNLHLFQPAPTISLYNQIPDNHVQVPKYPQVILVDDLQSTSLEIFVH